MADLSRLKKNWNLTPISLEDAELVANFHAVFGQVSHQLLGHALGE